MTGPTTRGAGRAARAINLAPFGRHSRYMLASYLRHIFMVAAALMLIALTIDLWPQIPLLTAEPGLDIAFSIVRLALLRVCDLLPPFIPFATFLGVVWSETVFTASQERMLIWNSGRSPLQCLTPAILTGLLIGATLFIMDAYLRPAAIHVQIAEKFGREGLRLDRTQSGGNHWVALQGGLLRAEIEYGPPLKLHDATIYKFDADGLLNEVDTAVLATPEASGDPHSSSGRWLLQNGHFWKAPPASEAPLALGASREEPETLFDQRSISMTLNVEWLGNLGMSPQYLTMTTLRSLAGAQIASNDVAGFRTRLQALYSEIFLPGLMAVLAAALAMLFFPYRVKPLPMIGVLMSGYLAHFSVTAFLLMGEFGYVPAFVAGWLVPLLIALGTGGVLYVIQKRRGLGAGLRDTPVLQTAPSR
jgi:lipopolysaccharide export system permease protein